MSLNLTKFEFLKTSIHFLGHITSSSGIQPEPTKISSITNFPSPRNLKGLRAFLGLTGYYRRFSPLNAERTQPLLELTKKVQKWRWEKKHQEAFDQVKTLFVKTIMLYPVSYTHLDVYKRQSPTRAHTRRSMYTPAAYDVR